MVKILSTLLVFGWRGRQEP